MIAYCDGIYRLTRDSKEKWNTDYWDEDKFFESSYDFVRIDYSVSKEYGFTEPITDVDYQGLSNETGNFRYVKNSIYGLGNIKSTIIHVVNYR